MLGLYAFFYASLHLATYAWLDQGLDLILPHTGLGCLHCLAMCFGSDVRRSLHDLDLFRRLEHAHLVHDRRRIDDRLWWVDRLAID